MRSRKFVRSAPAPRVVLPLLAMVPALSAALLVLGTSSTAHAQPLVTLSGSVRSREEKRFTEDLVERISGVRDVNNNLKVKPADDVLGTARSGSSVLGLTDNPPPPPTKTK